METMKLQAKGQKSAAFDLKTLNAEDNTVEVVFATETDKVLRKTDGGFKYYEILRCNPTAVMMERLNNGGAVIDNHNKATIRDQFGVVLSASCDVSANECRAKIKLTTRKEWEGVVDDIKKGLIRNISCGYNIYDGVEMGEKNGIPMIYATKWEPTEISFTLVSADYNSGTRGITDKEFFEINITNTKKNIQMDPKEQLRFDGITNLVRKLGLPSDFATTLIENKEVDLPKAMEMAIEEVGKRNLPDPTPTPATAPIPTPTPVNVEDLLGKERKRAGEIINVCSKLNLGNEYAMTLIADGKISLDEARSRAIDKAAENDNNIGKPNSMHGTFIKNDQRDLRATSMEDALLERVGLQRKDETGKIILLQPGMYRNMSMKEIAFESLRERNMDPRHMSEKELKAEIFGAPGSRSSGQMTTSDFPAIMENVLNKLARNPYELAEKTFEPFIKRTTAKDFKPMSRVSLHDVFIDESKDEIKESGEYTYAKLSDNSEKYAIRKWGKIVPFSWEALINDDLSMLDRTTSNLVGAWAQAQSRMIYKTLTSTTALADKSNVMYDNKTLFHADHNNIVGTSGTISVDSLTLMRKVLRTQKAPNGNFLNLKARYLVVGPALETLAEQFTSANFTPVESGKINKFGPTLTPIVDANITGNDWYIITAPGTLDTIEVATLNGNEVYTESQYSFKIDGFEIKIRFTWGQKAIDWRGFVRNPGA